MTRYAALVAIAFTARAATGGFAAIGYAGGAVLLTGLVLELGYRISVARWVRAVPRHRVTLDRLVRAQWVGAGLTGVGAAVVFGAFDVDPVGLGGGSPGLFFNAALTAFAVAVAAIFVSSLIDWYWILPRISGIVRKAPCEEAGGQLWARVTGVWLFHRGVATTIVAGSLSGVFVYMGEQDRASARGTWFIVAWIVAASTFGFLNAAGRALWLALNPRLHVGDTLDVHNRLCRVVDVSLQGAKYTRHEDDPREPFARKYDGSISLDDFGHFERAEQAAAPCAHGCAQVNWYCRGNATAYD